MAPIQIADHLAEILPLPPPHHFRPHNHIFDPTGTAPAINATVGVSKRAIESATSGLRNIVPFRRIMPPARPMNHVSDLPKRLLEPAHPDLLDPPNVKKGIEFSFDGLKRVMSLAGPDRSVVSHPVPVNKNQARSFDGVMHNVAKLYDHFGGRKPVGAGYRQESRVDVEKWRSYEQMTNPFLIAAFIILGILMLYFSYKGADRYLVNRKMRALELKALKVEAGESRNEFSDEDEFEDVALDGYFDVEQVGKL